MMNTQPMMGDPNQQAMPPQPDPSQMMGGDPSQQQGMQQDQMMGGEPPEGQTAKEPDQEDVMDNYIDKALSEANLAKKFRKKKDKDGNDILTKMGQEVWEGWQNDELSRKEWMERNKEWMELALLVRKNKSFPWPKASNVKYPLLATAAMQFAARAYPALVPSDGKVVKAKVIPYDLDGSLSKKADRIARHMSYQVMCKMPAWEEDMDKLLMTMAIAGFGVKKTYHASVLGTHHSHIVYPENFCVNYWAKSLEKAYRKTEILHYSENEVKEKINNDEEYLDVDLTVPETSSETLPSEHPITGVIAPQSDKSTPHVFLAQHTFYDLDGDGYEEPYVITIHEATKQVVRIIARWDMDGVHKDAKGKIIRIEPVEYFTLFPFIPNPDGSIYAIGFGILLGPLNESVNTIINQLIDAGTLATLQSGFLGKGLRVKMGAAPLQPGEWKLVNATGDDLKNSILPLPTKEPSGVLFNLLNMLITSGNQLASIAEIFVGKMPGQNTPASTTQETVKQGMAVFTAIYKRIYRSLEKEFKKIYRLNRISPEIVMEESQVLGIPLQSPDYDDDNLIIPGGDPTGDSESEKQQKIGLVGQMMSLGTIDPMKFTQWALESQNIPSYQNLLAQPQPPQPDPKAQLIQAQTQAVQQKAQIDAQSKQQDLQAKAQLAQMEMQMKQMELEFEKTKQAMEMQGQQMKTQMDMITQVNQQKLKEAQMHHDMQASAVKTSLDIQNAQQLHSQKLQANDMAFKQKQKQAQQKPKGKNPKQQ